MPERNDIDENLRGWGKHILKELDRNHDDHGEFYRLIRALEIQVAMLKVKSMLIGAAAGGILSIATGLVIWALTK